MSNWNLKFLTSELKIERNIQVLKRKNANHSVPVNDSKFPGHKKAWWVIFFSIFQLNHIWINRIIIDLNCNSSIDAASIKLRQKSCRKKRILCFLLLLFFTVESIVRHVICLIDYVLNFLSIQRDFFPLNTTLKKNYFLLYKKVKLSCDWTGWKCII